MLDVGCFRGSEGWGEGLLRPPSSVLRRIWILLAGLAVLAPFWLQGAVPGTSTPSLPSEFQPLAFSLQPFPSGTSTRSGPAYYRAAQTVTLTNLLAPLASVWMQTLTEHVPVGWTTSGISDGGSFDAASGSIRWMFFDNQVRPLRFTLLAPANASGLVTLSGTASFDGENLTVGGLLGLAAAPPPSGTVVRDLPDTYRGAVAFTVTLAVTPEADVDLHTVEEIVPAGWTVTTVSHAGSVFTNGTVRWGPFVDAASRALSYVVQAPAGASTNAVFRGTGSFGSVSVTTTGDTNVVNAPDMGGSAVRDLPAQFRPGTSFALSIQGLPYTNTQFWIVSETLPAGWAASNISDGGSYSEALQQVKWGPFIDSTSRTLTCDLISPGSATGAVVFIGQAQFDTVSTQTGGDSQTTAHRPSGGSVVRSLPRYYLPPQSLTVALTVTPAEDVAAQGIDDVFPFGWTVDPASVTGGGQVLTNERKVRWLFLDGLPRDLTYTITPPGDATGEARFAGQGSFDEVTSLTSGSTNIPLQPGGTATRSLPAYFVPVLPLVVVVEVVTDTNVVFLTVLDTPPAGWRADAISHGGSFDATNGIVRWIMEAGASPTALTYRAWPPEAATDSGQFDGTAYFDGRAMPVTGDTNLPANLPPTVSVIPDQTTLESEPVLMAILVTDPETATENLTIELTHTNTVLLPPENLTMNRVGNVIYLGLTPKPRRHGVDWFTLRVSDGVSIITRQFSWTVEDVADPLVIAPIAAYLNGVGYCALPSITGLGGATTIEAWVYPKTHVSDAVIVELGNDSNSNNFVLCASEGTTGKPRFYFRSGAAVVGSVTAPEAIPLNTWTHLAGVVQTNGVILLYVNGLEMAAGVAAPLPPAVTRAANFIGRSSSGGGMLNGALTDVRIWNVARTEAQIEASRSIGSIAGPEAGLLAAYPMGATGAAPLADVSGNSRAATLGGSISFYKSNARTLSVSGFTGSSSLYVDQGTLILNGTNSYTGTTTINAGTLQVGVGGTEGTLGSGNVVNNSSLVLNRSDDLTLPNTISGTGSVTKQGAGVVTIAGTNSYSGSTTVSAGTLRVNGRLGNSGVTVAPAATLGGTGAIAGPVTIQGTLAPGASVGTLNTGTQTWAPGGIYEWQINDATGTAGSNPGWDLLNTTGTLTVTATSGSKFTIKVVSLSESAAGICAHFNNRLAYSWRIATASGGVNDFSADKFTLNTDGFANSLLASNTFSIVQTGNDIYLNFTSGLAPPASTTNVLISSSNPSLPGASVTFTATVGVVAPGSGIPTNQIRFLTNGIPAATNYLDATGQAAYSTALLPHGSNSVTAEYVSDGNYLPSTNRVVQVVDRAPTSRDITASTTANHPLVLTLDKLLARASDADAGDTLTVTAAGPASTNGPASNVVLNSGAGTITYTSATGYVGADAFTYTVSDNYGRTVTPKVTVTVTSAGGISPNVVFPPTYSNGTFRVTFAGIPSFQYTIETAPTLTGDWSYLKKVVAGTNGLFQVIDSAGSSEPARYYRTVYP